MQMNETVKNLSNRQLLSYNEFCAKCIRADMSKIPAIQTLRSAYSGITGESMSLREAKDIVDHGYQVRVNQIVMEELPRALREQSVHMIISLEAQRSLLSRMGLEVRL